MSYLSGLCLCFLICCKEAPSGEETSPPPAATTNADREVWGARLDLSDPDLQVAIRASYMWTEGKQTYADSGVQIEFRGADSGSRSRLQARRMTLNWAGEEIGVAGAVHLEAQDSLEVLADTAVWNREEEELWVPGRVEIRASKGAEEGRDLRTGFDFEQWSIEAVAGRWRGDQEGRTYEVEIGARRAEGRWRDGYMEVDYDSATVSFQDVELHSARARYVEVEESMYFSGGVSGTDSLRRFTAVALNYALADQRVEAKGDVVWHEGEIELRAEYLVQDRVAREVEARGEKAFFARHGRSLAAAQLIYSSVPEQVLATGQVVYLEGERRLEVEQLLYRVSEERLEADGTAVLQVPEFSGAATAGELVFDLATEELVLREEPQLNLQRDQPLHMRAAQLRFDLGGRVLVGEPEFHLATGDLVLEAERGVYEDADERLVLVGAVKLRQERVEEAYKSHLRADSMVVKLRHGQVVQVALEGSVKADMHSADIQADWMEGERGQIFFEDQRLERIELEGAADATHQHLERGSVSRFKGERMELFFAAGTLERVEVVGRAEVVSRPPEEDGEEEFTPSHFRGEQLEIALEDGEVTRVDIVKPEGDIYAPQSEE